MHNTRDSDRRNTLPALITLGASDLLALGSKVALKSAARESIRQLVSEKEFADYISALRTDKDNFAGGKFTRAALRNFLEGLRSYQEGSGVKQRLLAELGADYFGKLKRLERELAGKINLQGLELVDGVIQGEARRVDFERYKRFCKRDTDPNLAKLCTITGAAMIVRSRDGQIVLQCRSDKNFPYGGVPGASIAGYLDATRTSPLQHGQRVATGPDPITESSIIERFTKEGSEEIGLLSDMFVAKQTRIIGLAFDHYQPHHEFLGFGQTVLDRTAITALALQHAAQKQEQDHLDFAEQIVFIDGNADSIMRFLTDVRCPMPPTHAMALLVTGRELVLAQKGEAEAEKWVNQVSTGAQQNYCRIDRIVEKFYRDQPAAFFRISDRFRNAFTEFVSGPHVLGQQLEVQGKIESYDLALKQLVAAGADSETLRHARLVYVAVVHKVIPERNLFGYTPTYLPTDQGLPDQHQEVERVFEGSRAKQGVLLFG